MMSDETVLEAPAASGSHKLSKTPGKSLQDGSAKQLLVGEAFSYTPTIPQPDLDSGPFDSSQKKTSSRQSGILPPAKTLRILCLDGGGVKGYTALVILQRIFRQLKRVAKPGGNVDIRPCDVFDLIVGTSTGGIIAIMLGRLKMTIEEALVQYEVVGKKVFGKRQKISRILTFRPFYDIQRLQSAVKDVLKERNMDEDAMLCEEDEDPACKVFVKPMYSSYAATDIY